MDHEQYLQKRNGVVAAAFEMSDQPMLVVDPSGKVVLASDGAGVLLGVARADIVGQELQQYFLRPESFIECRAAWHSGSTENRTLEIRHSQGGVKAVEARYLPFESDPLNSPEDSP